MMFCFLVSSLPEPKFEAPPPMSSAAFDEVCRETVPARTAETVAACTLETERENAATGVAALDAYRDFEQSLRSAVMRRRLAARKSRQEAVAPVETDSRLEALVSQAAGVTDPLERETLLDRARFTRLQELAEADEFGLGALVSYRLRLLLLEKRARMTAAAGRTHFETAVTALTQRSPSEAEN